MKLLRYLQEKRFAKVRKVHFAHFCEEIMMKFAIILLPLQPIRIKLYLKWERLY
jgi:hypothetical protein